MKHLPIYLDERWIVRGYRATKFEARILSWLCIAIAVVSTVVVIMSLWLFLSKQFDGGLASSAASFITQITTGLIYRRANVVYKRADHYLIKLINLQEMHLQRQSCNEIRDPVARDNCVQTVINQTLDMLRNSDTIGR
jgi:hypothetical protein